MSTPDFDNRTPPAGGEGTGEGTALDYRTLVDHVSAAILVLQDGRIRYANPKACAIFERSADELAAAGPDELVLPEDRAVVHRLLNQRADGLAPTGLAHDVRCWRSDGSDFTARVSVVPIELAGRPAELLTMHDVSELKRIARSAEQRGLMWTQAEELALIGSSEYDRTSGKVTHTTGMFRILGVDDPGAPVDEEWLARRVPASEAPIVRAILHGVQPGDPCEFEHRILRPDGTQRNVIHRAMAYADSRGRTTRVVGILQDVTAQRTAEQKLNLLANTDEVTGLPNRAALLDRLDAAARQARREESGGVLMLLRIAQLKMVSQSLGFAGGDRLLGAVGERLSSAALGQEILAHLGSGEYALVFCAAAGHGVPDPQALAHAVNHAFSQPVPIDDAEVQISCAIGAARFPAGTGDEAANLLLHQAQAAMHRSQQAGDHQLRVYTPEDYIQGPSRLTMESALRKAIERREFHLQYQPQLDLRTGAIVGVEALIRWNCPVRGRVSPLDFIPLAEETGLIVPIGDWVLREACTQNVAWQRAGLPPVRVAVNLSVRQVQQEGITRRIHQILVETGMHPRYLGLELTESMLIGESEHFATVLAELKALGIEISLDDFGTGYSNLSYLGRLPIDVVKVDRSFVADITAAAHDVSLTRAVITMAHSLQMKVLAEGVETEAQVAQLVANGCDEMQGYFFSPPVMPDVLAQMLTEARGLPPALLSQRQRDRTLLLVDDDADLLALLQRVLAHGDWRILTAQTAQAALDVLAEQPVDVILSDLCMPGMNGIELLRRAQAICPDTVRLLLSATAALHDVTDAINEGVVYKFLAKPWDDELLRGHVEEAFRRRQMADENRRLSGDVQRVQQQLADAGERLHLLEQAQTDMIDREEASQASARDMLDNIPVPVIGVDVDGLVAFVNADAEAMFPSALAMLGHDARDALPADLLQVWLDSDGRAHGVEVDGRRYQAVCREMTAPWRSRGKLLVLNPADMPPPALH